MYQLPCRNKKEAKYSYEIMILAIGDHFHARVVI